VPLCSLLARLLAGGLHLDWLWSWGGGSLSSLSVSLLGESLLLLGGVLGTSSLSLSSKILLTDGFGLPGVDLLNQNVLVLVEVTLGSEVELVVHLPVNLLVVSISLEKTTEDTESPHPEDALWHTGLLGSLSLSSAEMSALSPGLVESLRAGVRVHGHLASHDEFVLDQLANVLA